MTEQLTTFVELMAHLDLDAYTFLPEPHLETFHKLRRLREHANAGDNQALIEELQTEKQPNELVRVYAVSMIVSAKVNPEQLTILGRFLLNDKNLSLRIALAKKLKDVPLGVEHVARWLLQAVIYDPSIELRIIAAEAARNMDIASDEIWRNKVAILLKLVEESGYYREHLDIAALATAASPLHLPISVPDDRFRLADLLIALALSYEHIPRLTSIIAALIIQSCGHNLHSVLVRLEKFVAEHQDASDRLLNLRSEINSLRTPIELERNLKFAYHNPLQAVHNDVRSRWKASIINAQVSLLLRLGIVLTMSAIGLCLLIQGAFNLSNPTMWSVSFLQIALGLILLLIFFLYRGMVRDTQQTLVNIGTANIVYATFVQQSLDASCRYTTLLLQNRLTAVEVETANRLLAEAMKNSVYTLRGQKPPTLDELIDHYSK